MPVTSHNSAEEADQQQMSAGPAGDTSDNLRGAKLEPATPSTGGPQTCKMRKVMVSASAAVAALKVCSVCGDKALGFNFDAISCESCKAFFRRNASKAEIPECMFAQRCTMTVATRRFCTSCRLRKCLAVGMKPELVNADDLRRRKTLLLHRQGPLPVAADATAAGNTSPAKLAALPVAAAARVSMVTLIACKSETLDSINGDEEAAEPLPEEDDDVEDFADISSSTSPAAAAAHHHQHQQPSSSSLHCQVESMHQHVASQPVIASAPRLPIPDHQKLVVLGVSAPSADPPGGYRCLSHEQWLAVADLKQAYELSFSDASDDATPAGCRNVNTLVNSSGFIVKKLILFAKKLPDFVGLGQSCQIALLKGVVICTLFLRSAVHYHRDRDVWLTPKGEVPTAILKDIPGFAELYDDHLRFCRQFKLLLHDPYLVPIVQVLALFTPDRPSVTERTMVSDVQDRYICLLKHYLEGRNGFAEARRQLPKILQLLEDLQDLAERHGRLLLHVNPSEVEPLLLEVFDIAVRSTATMSVLGFGSM